MRPVLLLALLSAASLEAQAPQGARDTNRPPIPATASIIGVVTADEPGNRPVRRAVVAVNGSDATTGVRASRAAVTDDRGRFVMPSLPPGRYTLTVTKGGWITAYYGSKRPGRGPGLPIALGDAEQARADVTLVRGAVITGRIVDENGHPQVGVRPQLMEYRTLSGQRRLMQASLGAFFLAQTNDLGEYRLFGVPPGSYVVSASPGFQTASASGARMTTAEEVRWALQQTGPAPSGGAQTAPPPLGPAVTYAPVFYPGVADAAAATMITVAAGEERSGVDLVMNLVATSRIQGLVTRPDGQPARGAQLSISPVRSDISQPSDVGMRPTVDAQGRFTFPSVRPGQYLVMARASSQPPPPPGPPSAGGPPPMPGRSVLDLWGSTEITVAGRDITGLSLSLQPGMTVSGRVAFETSALAQPASLAGMRVMMASASVLEVGITGSVSAAQMNSTFMGPTAADGTFTFPGVMPGKYIITTTATVPPGSPPGSSWMTKSIMIRGSDALQSGFEIRPGEDLADIVITFTDQTSEISGTLLDAAGRPAPEYFVFVFPADKAAWTPLSQRLRPPVRPSSDGKFRITPLPKGEYYIVALTDFEQENLYDTSFLELVAASAFKIVLGEGEKKIQDLRIAR